MTCECEPCDPLAVGDLIRLRVQFDKNPEPNRGEYQAGTEYAIGEVVRFDCNWFVARCAGNIGSPP